LNLLAGLAEPGANGASDLQSQFGRSISHDDALAVLALGDDPMR
jgi:hypothetical protein